MSQSTPGGYAVTRSLTIDPFRLLLISLAGWLNQHQRDVIDYLQEVIVAADLFTVEA